MTLSCQHKDCSNEGRYIHEDGRFYCGIHDALTDGVSIRLRDLQIVFDYVGDILMRHRFPGPDTPDAIELLDRHDVNAILDLFSKRGVSF